MPHKIYTPEQIIRKLREAEVLIVEGMMTHQATRQIGVSEQTYYRWRKESLITFVSATPPLR